MNNEKVIQKCQIPGNDDDESEEEYSLVRYPITQIFENPSFTVVDNPNYHHLINKGSQRGSFLSTGSVFGTQPATWTVSEEIGYFCHNDNFLFGFGCDNSNETYKVVAYCNQETASEVRVLNLGGDDVWRNIESFPTVLGHKPVYLSGTVNWETDFVIWQMKKFGVEDSWTQLLKISYSDLLIAYYDLRDSDKRYFQLMLLFLSDDGDSLVLQSNLESQTILYNRRDNRAKRTEIIGTSDHAYWDYEVDYVESLVPIF
ncbi:hypothetical protein MTR_1g016960 [Medicago truncatula]|uniref:F-box associated interaction domain-containing protein n=1 Tax=Medicago truncatula TaxID=3880 RepID=A0A072VD71_MEDTR|nr:hypothetical protein MTR_1g016960 [Medicago truncatula]